MFSRFKYKLLLLCPSARLCFDRVDQARANQGAGQDCALGQRNLFLLSSLGCFLPCFFAPSSSLSVAFFTSNCKGNLFDALFYISKVRTRALKLTLQY